jgi:hypothetical protein
MAADPRARRFFNTMALLETLDTEPMTEAPEGATRDEDDEPRLRSEVVRREAPLAREGYEDHEDDDLLDLELLLGRKRLTAPLTPREQREAVTAQATEGERRKLASEPGDAIDLESIMRASVSSAPPSPFGPQAFWLGPPPAPGADGAKRRALRIAGSGIAAFAAVCGAFYAGTHFAPRSSLSASTTESVRPAAGVSSPSARVVRIGRNASRAASTEASAAVALASSSAEALPTSRAATRGHPASRASSETEPGMARRATSRASSAAEIEPSQTSLDDLAPPIASPHEAVAAESPSAEPLTTEAMSDAAPAPAVDPLSALPATQQTLEALMTDTSPALAEASVRPEAQTATTALPVRPSRAEIRIALTGVTPGIRACTAHRGVALATVKISGGGEVLSVTPVGSWAQEANAGCIRGAIAAAQLPHFQQSLLTVRFPFVL